MNWTFRVFSLVLIAVLPLSALALAGCGKPTAPTVTNIGPPPVDEHEEHAHKHPETFAEAVEQLSTFKSEIQTAFTSGDPDSAHDALHEVGHVLEELPTLAEKVTEDAEERKAVVEAQEKLFTAFGKLDETMHGGEDVKYETLQADIDAAMEALSGIGKK